MAAVINLFDKYRMIVPKGLKWHISDGLGPRVVRITDQAESFSVTFEEGMQMMDMLPRENAVPMVNHQCFENGKYIHLRRNSASSIDYAFFHIELEDDNGVIWYLPGQIVVPPEYQWTDGIEPVLMKLLEGISICA